ncbi:molybdate ABC transporter substrate-binding protein [Saccharicrinis sp. 156]|uniref:molybdate ABC transporter substrate-binding protein n=1 Tax=Saccharicrinis sp. 156 TaxID=3417574 RepID=UPI003D347B28
MKNKYSKCQSIISGTFILLLFLASCDFSNPKVSGTEAGKDVLMIFAGASLTDVLTEIIDSFEINNDVRVQTNFASSGTLARQIQQVGAPDVYISASKKWADYVDSLGMVQPDYKTVVASNQLVFIAPLKSNLKIAAIESSFDIVQALGSGRLSIGDPSHVPAGKYAEQALTHYGWYHQVKKQSIPAKDVRSALMFVELGEAPLGIVYKTDALKSKKVKILGTFPETSHEPILFIASVCKNNPRAKDFYAFLNSAVSKQVWNKHGFKN